MGKGGSWGPGEVQGESWGIHIPEVIPKSSHDRLCQLCYRRTDLSDPAQSQGIDRNVKPQS
jgi:hypothetical protein